jgi:hypothetical protein
VPLKGNPRAGKAAERVAGKAKVAKEVGKAKVARASEARKAAVWCAASHYSAKHWDTFY